MTRPYAEVIGDPIAHSKSALIHNFWLQKLGIDAEYRTCHVRPDELADYFAQRRQDSNWRGCNVTIPHKVAVLPLLDGIHRGARAIGAVNTVHFVKDGDLHGKNTDVDGIWRTLDAFRKADEAHVVLIGAGGAARAFCQAIKGWANDTSVTVIARSADKGARLLADFELRGGVEPFGSLPPADLIVNASPLGMTGQPDLPVTLDRQSPQVFVFDMVYSPLRTSLIADAEARGLQAINGMTMLIEQARSAFSTFFEKSAYREYDAELRALLTA